MASTRYNYDKKGLKELEDIKNQTGFTDIMGAENKGTTDYGITQGVSDADYTGGGDIDRAIEYLKNRMKTIPEDMHPYLLNQYVNDCIGQHKQQRFFHLQ